VLKLREVGMESILVEDGDALVRAAVVRLVEKDGMGAQDGSSISGERPSSLLRFVGVHGLVGVAACPLRRRELATPSPTEPYAVRTRGSSTTVLYVLRDYLAAELHRLHRCADHFCVFVPDDRGGRLEPLARPGRLEIAGLTPREADVLALLLARRTNPEIAQQLVLSEATVRAHCRAVLRKVGAVNRRALWGLLPCAEDGYATLERRTTDCVTLSSRH